MPERKETSDSRVSAGELRSFTKRVLECVGVDEEHASTVSEGLVRAELRGVDSHGIARLDAYVRKFEAGGFNTHPEMTVTPVADSVVIVDADDGPGQSAGVRAIDEAMILAAERGVGVAGVTNSNHFGTAAYYTERASDEGFIGISMTNVESDVAPFGGTDAFLGTNPISVSIPTDRQFPITLDMATSAVAMGKIDHALDGEETIPESWAFDDAGEPTTDPAEVAALRPVGGPKGYGLGMVVDVLCGILPGVGTSPTIGPLYDDFDTPMKLGHFFIALDPTVVRDLDAFKTDVGRYIDQIKSQQPRAGVTEIRVPGELESIAKRKHERDGIQLNEDAVRGVRSLAERYDCAPPAGLSDSS